MIELIKDTTEYVAAAENSQFNSIVVTVAILAIAIFLSLLLGRSVSRPLVAMTAIMNRLSSGETDVAIPGSGRRDELGVVQVFKDNMIETSRLRTEQELTKKRVEVERRGAMLELADKFEA
ncbi:MAG: methyl-accepting chemotaxis protein, partial [Acetobacteraceae bacterium]|nr:methyl-accepting chemotaxis protein [Acetobacteraceae bacterium]